MRQKIGRTIVSPQTCDKNKIRFLEVNLDEKKCLKSIGNSCVFSILVKSFKKYDFGMRVFSGRFSAAALLYIISTIRQTHGVAAGRSLPFWYSFVGTYPPPRFPALVVRTLKSPSPPFPPKRCRETPSCQDRKLSHGGDAYDGKF